MTFDHEEVLVRKGEHSGLTVIVAVHSTALGQAIGGCRFWHYPDWRDGLADALRLSEGMTYKCAVAGLANGGGKTVVVAPETLSADRRQAAMRDVAEAIVSLDGRYATGPDAGTGPADMQLIADRTAEIWRGASGTQLVFCRPPELGGSGDSSPATAIGVLAATRATCAQVFGTAELAGRRVALIGLGHVGAHLARALAAAGAELVVADIDPAKRALADELGAAWVRPDEALTAEVDVVMPAALGGVLTTEVVPALRCAAIVGPANNQLADQTVAERLHDRGIVWTPDYLVSAGGVIFHTAVELAGASADEARQQVEGIGAAVTDLLAAASRTGQPPHHTAQHIAAQRLATASVAAGSRPPGASDKAESRRRWSRARTDRG